MPDALQAFIRALPEFSAERPAASPLVALYADLSAQKHSNRGAYRAKVDWWASTLREACWRGVQSDGRDADAFVLHLDSAVSDRWAIDAVGKPLGIAVVVVRFRRSGAWLTRQKELAQQRRAVRLDEFLRARAQSPPAHPCMPGCGPTGSCSRPGRRSLAGCPQTTATSSAMQPSGSASAGTGCSSATSRYVPGASFKTDRESAQPRWCSPLWRSKSRLAPSAHSKQGTSFGARSRSRARAKASSTSQIQTRTCLCAI